MVKKTHNKKVVKNNKKDKALVIKVGGPHHPRPHHPRPPPRKGPTTVVKCSIM